VNLEALDVRRFAHEDPRGFLAMYPEGAIFDEVQRAPDLLSYLQVEVDAHPQVRGRYVLTGSQNFGLLSNVSQSLAGRTAVLELLPMTFEELSGFPDPPHDLFETLWKGGYPSIFDRDLAPADWFTSYVTTYVERDIRQLVAVTNTIAFRTFLGLCAGASGQMLNVSRLGADTGITHNTAQAWLSALEASYLCFRLPPFTHNARKTLTKTPKLYFYDTGLLCYLLGIRSASELRMHPLRGSIFETWVASELIKNRSHRGEQARLSFYRDRKGFEIDFLLQLGAKTIAIEAKSGATIADDFFLALDDLSQREPQLRHLERVVVFGGDQKQIRSQAKLALPWRELHQASFWNA